jgi:hypothetical protein
MGTTIAVCPRCRENAEIGRGGYCRTCQTSVNRAYKDRNREHLRVYKQRYYATDVGKAQIRRARLRRKFDLTPEQYSEMWTAQRGLCAICHRVEPREGYALAVDHDHTTGEVRGLLCSHCNRGIGWLSDDPELLRSAIGYLTGIRPC